MKQITEDYVSFEIAQLLKEKGFDIPTINFYDTTGKDLKNREYIYGGFPDFGEVNWNNDPFVCEGFPKLITFSKPTQSLALRWLREVHKLHIFAKPYWPQGDMRNKMSWQGFIVDLNTINGDSQCYADSYEEAIENRIRFALENLI